MCYICIPVSNEEWGSSDFAKASSDAVAQFGIIRALSSVGSEHLPYKQGVAGSNPAGPTKQWK